MWSRHDQRSTFRAAFNRIPAEESRWVPYLDLTTSSVKQESELLAAIESIVTENLDLPNRDIKLILAGFDKLLFGSSTIGGIGL